MRGMPGPRIRRHSGNHCIIHDEGNVNNIMNTKTVKRALVATAMVTALSTGWATPSNAATDITVGNNAGAQYWFAQTTGDCELAAFDTIYGEIKGTRMHETTIIAEGIRLGVVVDGVPALGSNWFGPNGLAKLAAHYGIKMTLGSHKLATIEADLKAGDHIMAFINAETVWATMPLTDLPPLPVGNAYDFSTQSAADHALVVDSIDETTQTVTLTDSGNAQGGALETVSVAAFSRAVATSGYQYAVASKNGK